MAKGLLLYFRFATAPILMGAYELLSLVCSLVQAIVAIILLYFEIKRNKTIDFKKEKR